MRIITSALLLFIAAGAWAQPAPTSPCSSPASHQFDFWLGTWDCVYSDTVHASNVVTKEQGGCVIHEHFSNPASNYTGESWSVYNPGIKAWQQTWVDNAGGYIVLTGSFQDSTIVLSTLPHADPKGRMLHNRMVYQHITKERFDWSWESSTDDGNTWTTDWSIHYKRKK